jgi:predicted nucleic acid-binding protein
MILADTSLWVELFRRGRPKSFAHSVTSRRILMHPAVLGELATGNLRDRGRTLAMLRSLPHAKTGTTDECLAAIEAYGLYGRGVGWIDVQLLVAARLSHATLWSLDEPLIEAAQQLKVAYSES